MPEHRRPPEQLLADIENEEKSSRWGRLKIILGYASGVGKSAQMFEEGLRRRQRGEDVVVGAVQGKSSPEVQALLVNHEIIPTISLSGKEVVNLPEILRRRPQVVLIDGLAHRNPPGSKHAWRWQDVDELLEAGISVVTTINLQFVDELQDEVFAVTGKRSPDSVPKRFLERANEIVVADAPAGEGENNLSRLREMTMLLAAEVIDRQLQSYLRAHGIEEVWGTQERILVCITPRSNAREILESGRRNADRFHGELFAVYVRQPNLSPEDRQALENNLRIAKEVHAQVETLEGRDYVRTLIGFARGKGVTQIFIGHTQRHGWWNRFRGNPVDRLIESAEGIDVRVFPQKARP